MRSLDGPGSYAGSGVDVDINDTYFDCEDATEGESACGFSGWVESYNGYVECPDCGIEVFRP